MPPSLQILRLHNCSIYEQLKLEEALLRTDSGNWCIINQGSTPAIVLGISGKLDQLVERSVWTRQPIPLIRRFSGGGTVVIDDQTLLTTVICNEADSGIAAQPEAVLRYNWELCHPLLAEHDYALQSQDYALGEHKIAGNAQYMRKGRWLHHTSWLWDYSPENMRYLKQPPKQPTYRAGRNHLDFITPLKKYLDNSEQLVQQLRSSLAEQYTCIERSLSEASHWLTQPHRNSLSYVDWDSVITSSASRFHSATTSSRESSLVGG